MATKIGDIMFPTGTYIKDGEEKTQWSKCGVVLNTDRGMTIKLDLMPVGIEKNGGWFKVFEDTNEPKATPAPAKASPPLKDDLPF